MRLRSSCDIFLSNIRRKLIRSHQLDGRSNARKLIESNLDKTLRQNLGKKIKLHAFRKVSNSGNRANFSTPKQGTCFLTRGELDAEPHAERHDAVVDDVQGGHVLVLLPQDEEELQQRQLPIDTRILQTPEHKFGTRFRGARWSLREPVPE